ncbi:MAG: CHAT domain-containing protein, partial [Candidatus Helarchaeota archaeon]
MVEQDTNLLELRLLIKGLNNQYEDFSDKIEALKKITALLYRNNQIDKVKKFLLKIIEYQKIRNNLKDLLLQLRNFFSILEKSEPLKDKKDIINEMKKWFKNAKRMEYIPTEISEILGLEYERPPTEPISYFEKELENELLSIEDIDESSEVLENLWNTLVSDITFELSTEDLQLLQDTSDINLEFPEEIEDLTKKMGYIAKKEVSKPSSPTSSPSEQPFPSPATGPAPSPPPTHIEESTVPIEKPPIQEKKKKIKPKKSIRRYADILIEKEMKLNHESRISVQLKKYLYDIMGTAVALDIRLTKKKKMPEIEVLVIGPGFEIPIHRKVLEIPLDKDSDILEFTVIPKETGKRYLFIEFYQNGMMIGRGVIEVNVKKEVEKHSLIHKSLIFRMADESNIDITLRIIRFEDMNKFIFTLFTKQGGTIIDTKASFGIKEFDEEYIETLNELIRDITLDLEAPEKSIQTIIKLGKKVYELIPEPMRDAIKNINPKYLIIETGDLFVPFELAHDGEDFLCLKYCLGKRIIDEYSDFTIPPMCFGSSEFDFILIESNPKQDLELKEKENYKINFSIISGKNANKKILNVIFNNPIEIIHFAGHGIFDEHNPDKSGILLNDGLLTARDLKNKKIKGYPLIFANTCESAIITKKNKMKGV